MKDPAMMGNCLSCGASCYAQSHCDKCADDDRRRVEECCECEQDLYEGDYVLAVSGGIINDEGEFKGGIDSLGVYCKECGEKLKLS